MAAMNQWEWKQTMLKGCDLVDDFLKDIERPSSNSEIIGKSFPRIADLQLLVRPARRRVEVLVYANKKWWRQSCIRPGMVSTKIHLGNVDTIKGHAVHRHRRHHGRATHAAHLSESSRVSDAIE
jgi:hypothetical protein